MISSVFRCLSVLFVEHFSSKFSLLPQLGSAAGPIDDTVSRIVYPDLSPQVWFVCDLSLPFTSCS